MREFAPQPDLGRQRISARDQTKLFLKIDRFVVPRHRRFAMRLLGLDRVLPALGHRPGAPARLGALLQGRMGAAGSRTRSGCCAAGSAAWRVAVFTAGQSAAYGRETEREVARRLLRGLTPGSVPR